MKHSSRGQGEGQAGVGARVQVKMGLHMCFSSRAVLNPLQAASVQRGCSLADLQEAASAPFPGLGFLHLKTRPSSLLCQLLSW